MKYKRLRKAKLIAKKRFKYWYPEMDMKKEPARMGDLRKNNVRCSRDCCCNPRHSKYYSGREHLHINERKAPTINEVWE